MAQVIQTLLVDDLDGGEADETVSFALDGNSYEMDLSLKHAEELRDALAPYVDSARKVTAKRGGQRKTSTAPTPDVDTAAVRAWAEAQGYEISSRGRIPKEVVDAYKNAQTKLDGALSSEAPEAPDEKPKKRASRKRKADESESAETAETPDDDSTEAVDVDVTPGVEGADEA